jgi:hypothetical protein|tara:strand:- start:9652 stop:10833 length:1182 start_codon:yes stop_codon:yes gene_type:complete
MAQNLFLHLAQNPFGEQDGDGIQLEGSLTERIILDGIPPTPQTNFIVDETNGDNFIAEFGTVGQDTNRFLAETSVLTFTPFQVQSVGDRLLQDNPTNQSTFNFQQIGNINISNVLRPSKILSEQPNSIQGFELDNKLVAEFDGTTPIASQDGRVITLEDTILFNGDHALISEDGTVPALTRLNAEDGRILTAEDSLQEQFDDTKLNPNRSTIAGQGDINSGSIDEDGFELEESGGVLTLDGTDESSSDLDSQLKSEDNFRFLLEDNGSLILEEYDTRSLKRTLATESNQRIQLETSLQPEPKDGIQLEVGTGGGLESDQITLEDDFAVLIETDFLDIAAEFNHLISEESTKILEVGQIPSVNYGLGVNQGIPNNDAAIGMQPVTRSSVIITRT